MGVYEVVSVVRTVPVPADALAEDVSSDVTSFSVRFSVDGFQIVFVRRFFSCAMEPGRIGDRVLYGYTT